MKVIITESRKITKDYNSTQLGYTVELEVQPNELQTKTQEIEKWIGSQFQRRCTEKEATRVFEGAQISGTPKTQNNAPSTNPPRTNGNQTGQNKTGQTVSPSQMKRLYAIALNNNLVNEYKTAKAQMGIKDTKEFTTCTKEQYKYLESVVGA